MSKLVLVQVVLMGLSGLLQGQKNISITIDDIPNTKRFAAENYNSVLLRNLDSMNIPIAIFVNEGLVHRTDSLAKNLALFEDWVSKEYVTLGNHTYAHSRYSEVGFDVFAEDVIMGERLLNELAEKYDKPVSHFRFPYNDLGLDSMQHVKMDSLLLSRNYLSSPFTVESSDWMFNYCYEYYLDQSNFEKAQEIGQMYVSATLDYVHFFDSVSVAKYGRSINQIYLCHDNAINAEYLDDIVRLLEHADYQFIDLDEAVSDKAYHQEYNYYRKWGVSWIYRWMDSQSERVRWMKQEPDISSVESLFGELSAE